MRTVPIVLALCVFLTGGCGKNSNAFCWSPNPSIGTGEKVPPHLYKLGYRGRRIPGCLLGGTVKLALQEPSTILNPIAAATNPVAAVFTIKDLIRMNKEAGQ